jgi:hypothetical protein
MRSVTENLLFATFAKEFGDRFSLGLTFRLYYYRLYDGMTASTVGLDLGFLYVVSSQFRIGGTIQDLNSKYRWDSGKIYDRQGVVTTDEFPLSVKFGASWSSADTSVILALDFVSMGSDTKFFRGGAEWNPMTYFSVRAGIDRVFPDNTYGGSTPTFGFAVHYPLEGVRPTLSYTFGIEPFAPRGIHMITASVIL